MKKTDPTVRRETLFVAAVTGILSLLMQAVFLILRCWDVTVLTGNLLGAGAGILNFYLMGRTVQKAVDQEPKQAATTMRLSQGLRLLMLFLIALAGVLLPWTNTVAVLIPLFFPRIAVMLRPMLGKRKGE